MQKQVPIHQWASNVVGQVVHERRVPSSCRSVCRQLVRLRTEYPLDSSALSLSFFVHSSSRSTTFDRETATALTHLRSKPRKRRYIFLVHDAVICKPPPGAADHELSVTRALNFTGTENRKTHLHSVSVPGVKPSFQTTLPTARLVDQRRAVRCRKTTWLNSIWRHCNPHGHG